MVSLGRKEYAREGPQLPLAKRTVVGNRQTASLRGRREAAGDVDASMNTLTLSDELNLRDLLRIEAEITVMCRSESAMQP